MKQEAIWRTYERLDILELSWQLSVSYLSCMCAFQDVIQMDRFVLGRALDVCSWSRLRERLRACTPRSTRRMTKNNRAGTRGILCLDFVATLLEMERLVHQRELV